MYKMIIYIYICNFIYIYICVCMKLYNTIIYYIY